MPENHFMKQIFFLLLISFTLASTVNAVQLGVYAGAPIVNDTVAFELQANEKAIVTSDYFNSDGNRTMKPKNLIRGTWKYKEPFLLITFGKFQDKLRKENCPQLNPCFKFENSEGKGLSPLNVPYGFGLRN